MVKLLSSSITALVMAIAVIQAQTVPSPASAPGTINPKDYPAANQVPPVNSPQVQQWLKEIDLTGAPSIPLHKGAPPNCPNPPIKDEYVVAILDSSHHFFWLKAIDLNMSTHSSFSLCDLLEQ